MLAVYGVLLLAFSAVFFIWAHWQFRRAAPKRWTTWESATQAVVLTIIGSFALGIGLLINALTELSRSPMTWTHAATIAAIVIAAAALGLGLRRRAAPDMGLPVSALLAGQDPVLAAAAVANDTGPDGGPRPASGTKRRAA